MPTYNIENQKTGEVKEIFCSWKDKEKVLKQEGNDWKYLIGAPGFVSELEGTRARKAGGEWASVLKKIDKEAGPTSTVFKSDPYKQG